MNLLWMIGSGAVGKMTVGQELMKITNYRLFHNHHMIEPVIEIFGKFNGSAVNKLRDVVFEEYMKTDNDGMIFTYMWAFDMQSDWDYVKYVSDKFEQTGGTVYYVELVADQKVRLERNETENRLKNKASKRDTDVSKERIIREETRYRLVSKDGEIPFKNYMKIDNTNLEASEVAKMIKEHFNLPDKDNRDLVLNVKLEEAREDELHEVHRLQIESFMPLYEVYRDEGSPATQTIEKIRSMACDYRKWYFIVYYGARVGAINVGWKDTDGDGELDYHISPLFVIPKFQNRGIGCVAINKLFELYPEAKVWRLSTILQEQRNRHVYEKCGFVREEGEKIVNDKLTLIDYKLDKR